MNQYKFTLNQNDKCWFRIFRLKIKGWVEFNIEDQVISSKDIKHDGIIDMLCIEA